MSDDTRLERIEKKLDDMSEAIICLARIEERMITVFKRMDNFEDTLKVISTRVGDLETGQGRDGQALRFAERLFWIVASASVGYFILGSGQ